MKASLRKKQQEIGREEGNRGGEEGERKQGNEREHGGQRKVREGRKEWEGKKRGRAHCREKRGREKRPNVWWVLYPAQFPETVVM